MAKRRFFSGGSIEQAVLEAAGHHGLDPRDLAWREVEKRHGFLRARRHIVIEVDPDHPRREGEGAAEELHAEESTAPPEAPASGASMPGEAAEAVEIPPAQSDSVSGAPEPTPEMEATPAQAAPEPFDTTPARKAPAAATEAEVREALELLLELSDLAVDPHVSVREGVGKVDLRGPEERFLREDDGDLLKVFELLGLRMLGGRERGLQDLRIDSGGCREERDQALRRRAIEAAQEVASGGESMLLEPMDAADRRLVHLAVEGIDGVTTRSEGRGEEKRVRVSREGEG